MLVLLSVEPSIVYTVPAVTVTLQGEVVSLGVTSVVPTKILGALLLQVIESVPLTAGVTLIPLPTLTLIAVVSEP